MGGGDIIITYSGTQTTPLKKIIFFIQMNSKIENRIQIPGNPIMVNKTR